MVQTLTNHIQSDLHHSESQFFKIMEILPIMAKHLFFGDLIKEGLFMMRTTTDLSLLSLSVFSERFIDTMGTY